MTAPRRMGIHCAGLPWHGVLGCRGSLALAIYSRAKWQTFAVGTGNRITPKYLPSLCPAGQAPALFALYPKKKGRQSLPALLFGFLCVKRRRICARRQRRTATAPFEHAGPSAGKNLLVCRTAGFLHGFRRDPPAGKPDKPGTVQRHHHRRHKYQLQDNAGDGIEKRPP